MEDKEEKEEINTKEELRTIKINKEETETWEFKRRRTRRSRSTRIRGRSSKTITRTIVEVAGETSKGKPGICPTHWCQLP